MEDTSAAAGWIIGFVFALLVAICSFGLHLLYKLKMCNDIYKAQHIKRVFLGIYRHVKPNVTITLLVGKWCKVLFFTFKLCKIKMLFVASMSLYMYYSWARHLFYELCLHSSEKRGLCSTYCSRETLQNLPYYCNKKTHVVFFVFHFVQLYVFT